MAARDLYLISVFVAHNYRFLFTMLLSSNRISIPIDTKTTKRKNSIDGRTYIGRNKFDNRIQIYTTSVQLVPVTDGVYE